MLEECGHLAAEQLVEGEVELLAFLGAVDG